MVECVGVSKAFTKEDDAEPPERSGRVRPASGLPPGAVNYMTAEGADRLRTELDRLLERERSAREAGVPRVDSVGELISDLRRCLDSATVVPVHTPLPDTVLFGATVTLLGERGERTHYRIVGVDETHFEPGWVSWLSPLAKSLIGARVGQHLLLRNGSREEKVEVLAIDY